MLPRPARRTPGRDRCGLVPTGAGDPVRRRGAPYALLEFAAAGTGLGRAMRRVEAMMTAASVADQAIGRTRLLTPPLAISALHPRKVPCRT